MLNNWTIWVALFRYWAKFRDIQTLVNFTRVTDKKQKRSQKICQKVKSMMIIRRRIMSNNTLRSKKPNRRSWPEHNSKTNLKWNRSYSNHSKVVSAQYDPYFWQQEQKNRKKLSLHNLIKMLDSLLKNNWIKFWKTKLYLT